MKDPLSGVRALFTTGLQDLAIPQQNSYQRRYRLNLEVVSFASQVNVPYEMNVDETLYEGMKNPQPHVARNQA